jgi:hypothetical protein
MILKTFISIREHKLLLATILFSFFLIFSSCCLLTLKNYNAYIQESEVERKDLSEGGEHSDFVICNYGQTYPEFWCRFFSFVFLPVSFFLVRKRNSCCLLVSFLLTLFPFFNFLSWFYKTERHVYYRELHIENWTCNFLYDSNSFDLLLFYLIPILLAWHLVIMCRLIWNWLTVNINLS